MAQRSKPESSNIVNIGLADRRVAQSIEGLSALVSAAQTALDQARGAAEVLEAQGLARVARSAAKEAARLARQGEAEELQEAARQLQGRAIELEARGSILLADEYDAAQERGEVAKGRPKSVPGGNTLQATTDEIGLTGKQIHEARQFRDAEAADPGVIRRTIDEQLEAGEEPTKAAIRKAILDAVAGGGVRQRHTNPDYKGRDPLFSAQIRIAANCREICELFGTYSSKQIEAGFLDDDMRERNLARMRQAVIVLSTFLEEVDHG